MINCKNCAGTTFKDGKWIFSCGLRGDSSITSKTTQGYKNLDNAKVQAKAFLHVVENLYHANRIFIGEKNEN